MLAIGGSDSCGGAGIQGDIKTGAAMGIDVSTAVTAITAQNSLGVQAVAPVSVEMLRAQIASVCSDLPPDAVKLGMLYDAERVTVVMDAIRTYNLQNVVCDPVFVSTSGRVLLDEGGREALLSNLSLFTLLTPNLMEAEALTGIRATNASDLLVAGRALLDCGASAVLLKGGHLSGAESIDILIQRAVPDPVYIRALRIQTRNDHGTGCALASSIATGLAMGLSREEAVKSGRAFVQSALERSAQLRNGSGRGSMALVRPIGTSITL